MKLKEFYAIIGTCLQKTSTWLLERTKLQIYKWKKTEVKIVTEVKYLNTEMELKKVWFRIKKRLQCWTTYGGMNPSQGTLEWWYTD